MTSVQSRGSRQVRYCPYDGSMLQQNRFCSACNKEINMQPKAPRMPRNFYEERPQGCEDNYVDENFLQGLVHKSKWRVYTITNFRQFSEASLFGNDQTNFRDSLSAQLDNSLHCKCRMQAPKQFFQTTIYAVVNSDDDFADTIFIATVAIVILVYSTYLFFNWEKDKLDFSQCCD